MDVSVLADQQEFISISSVRTGCSLEDLLGAMDDRDGWREERVSEISVVVDDDDDFRIKHPNMKINDPC